MDIPQDILDRIERERPSGKRRTFTAEQMRDAIDYAHAHSVPRASKEKNIAYTTVKHWYEQWVASRVYPVPGVRGRPKYFNDEEEAEVMKKVDQLRADGTRITASSVATIGRDIQQRHCSLQLAEHGGARVFSCAHANGLLRRAPLRASATTDEIPDVNAPEDVPMALEAVVSECASYPERLQQRVDKEEVVLDPKIIVDWVMKKNSIGQPFKILPDSEKIKQQYKRARAERRSLAKAKATFKCQTNMVLIVNEVD